jgi:hypothetical protein
MIRVLGRFRVSTGGSHGQQANRQEGWTAISAGGADGSNRTLMVFHK